MALALAGIGAYFGLTAGGAAPSASVSSIQPSPLSASSPPTNGFELWFIRGWAGAGCCGAFPTWRTAAQLDISPDEDIHTRREINGPDENRRATDLLERVLTSLIAGPTPADQELLDERTRDAGFPEGDRWQGSFPPDTQLLGVTLSNGIATIDISYSDEFGNADPYVGPHVGVDLLFSGLVFTATQVPFVDGVLFKLDGQPVKAQIINVQALKAALELDPRPVTAQILWAQIWEALKTDEPPYFSWDDRNIYERVGRPVTRADYEGTREQGCWTACHPTQDAPVPMATGGLPQTIPYY